MNELVKSTVILGIITITFPKLHRCNNDMDGNKSILELRWFLFSGTDKIKHKELEHN